MLSTQLTTPNYQVKKSGQHTSSQTTSTLHIYSLIHSLSSSLSHCVTVSTSPTVSWSASLPSSKLYKQSVTPGSQSASCNIQCSYQVDWACILPVSLWGMLLTNQSVGQSVKHITLNKSIKGGGRGSKIPIIKVLCSLFSLLPSFFLLSW